MECPDADGFSARYISYVSNIAKNVDPGQINGVISLIKETYARDKNIFIIGNGGSAATASHLAVDIGKGAKIPGRRPFRAISLTDNTPLLTAYANDEGADSLFVGQLETLLRPDDLIIGISASGNSPNLVEAFSYARAHGAKTSAMLGFDGGKLKAFSDAYILVSTPKGEYGPVEDVHMLISHAIALYLQNWSMHSGE